MNPFARKRLQSPHALAPRYLSQTPYLPAMAAPAPVAGPDPSVEQAFDDLLSGRVPQAPAPAPAPAPAASPLLDGGIDDGLGTLQTPVVNQALAENLMTALSGLSGAQARQQKQFARDERRTGIDRFVGNVVMPLTGLIPGNTADALTAAERLKSDVAAREAEWRKGSADQMNLVSALAGVIKKSDPNDMDSILKQQRELRLLQKQREGSFADQSRHDLGQKRIDLQSQIAADNKTYKGDVLKQRQAEHKQKIEYQKGMLAQQKANLDQRIREAEQRGDKDAALLAFRERDAVRDEEMEIWKLEQGLHIDAEKIAQDDRKIATEKTKDGELKNPEFKPIDAKTIVKGAPQAPKRAVEKLKGVDMSKLDPKLRAALQARFKK